MSLSFGKSFACCDLTSAKLRHYSTSVGLFRLHIRLLRASLGHQCLAGLSRAWVELGKSSMVSTRIGFRASWGWPWGNLGWPRHFLGRPSVRPFICASVRRSVRPSVLSSVHPSVGPFVCPSIGSSVHRSVGPIVRPTISSFMSVMSVQVFATRWVGLSKRCASVSDPVDMIRDHLKESTTNLHSCSCRGQQRWRQTARIHISAGEVLATSGQIWPNSNTVKLGRSLPAEVWMLLSGSRSRPRRMRSRAKDSGRLG